MARSSDLVTFPRDHFYVTVTDNSLRTLSILPNDLLVCVAKPYYDDFDLVFCRTVGTQSDPLQSHLPADVAYYVGRYVQLTDLVTVLLPNGTSLVGNVLIIANVSNVIRLYE